MERPKISVFPNFKGPHFESSSGALTGPPVFSVNYLYKTALYVQEEGCGEMNMVNAIAGYKALSDLGVKVVIEGGAWIKKRKDVRILEDWGWAKFKLGDGKLRKFVVAKYDEKTAKAVRDSRKNST